MEIIDEAFSGVFQGELPSHTEISNWARKNGLATYIESGEKYSGTSYCSIIDESIDVGSQKVLVTLATSDKPSGQPLRHEDVDVLGIDVAPSWNGEAVYGEIEHCSKKVGHTASYIISDNGANLAKGIRQTGIVHHRDISHSFGLILEDVYKGQADFEGFTAKLNGIRLKYHLTEYAFLLPPKQRTIARFMNIFNWVQWAEDMLKAYPKLTPKQQKAFSFVVENKTLIEELASVMETIRSIEQKCKYDGISMDIAKLCIWKALKLSRVPNANWRTTAIGVKISLYLFEEAKKIVLTNRSHIICSDIIESTFGWYKMKKSCNKLCGVTASVLNIAVIGKLSTKEGRKRFNVKKNMESVRLSDIKEWRDLNLLDNLAVNRKEILKNIA